MKQLQYIGPHQLTVTLALGSAVLSTVAVSPDFLSQAGNFGRCLNIIYTVVLGCLNNILKGRKDTPMV